MSQILMVELGLDWFRNANKYIENLKQFCMSRWGDVTILRNENDDKFIDEFDFIIKNMGF
jgi:hypothetical protein